MRGFSLIEVLVAASIFAVAVGSLTALFVISLNGQRNIFAQQNVVNNTRFGLEYMTRQIRMARRDATGSCTGTPKMTYNTATASTLIFMDYRGNCVTYKKTGTKIEAQIGKGAAFDLTSNDIEVDVLSFSSQGALADDNEQPRVTINMEAKDPSAPSVNIQLQTTVSGRNLDVK